MRIPFARLWSNSDGGVLPVVALSLTALIAIGGVAFDYAHVAAMDTELQDAADHAALAAATQLDGSDGAQDRATQAAKQLISNSTHFAAQDSTHDGTVGIANVTFYSAYTSAGSASNKVALGDSDANFVQVEVDTRTANYALTPIVGAFYGSLNAKAVAGLDSAVCGVVPFFVCNPVEPANNKDASYSLGGLDPGTGIVMAQGGTQWGPGNFGFLDQLGNGANGVAEALASNHLFGNCQPTSGVTTETGNILNAVRDSLNMRFDFNPGNASACKNGPCQPSSNVIKDVVKASTGGTCSWQSYDSATEADMDSSTPPKYFPVNDAELASSITPKTMGSPRDICHYYQDSSGNYPLCANARVGDGKWDRAAYFRTNHPGLDWQDEPGLGPNVTRYQTYLWEAADTARMPTKALNASLSAYGQPQSQCLGNGLAPDPNGVDRRRITAAVVNCHAAGKLNGKKNLTVAGFIDIFLVEPSISRSRCAGKSCVVTAKGTNYVNNYASANDIYVEVIGGSGTGEGGSTPQITRRDIPRLIE